MATWLSPATRTKDPAVPPDRSIRWPFSRSRRVLGPSKLIPFFCCILWSGLLNHLIDRTCSLECAFPWWRFCFGCSGTRLYCLRGWTMWWVSRCVFVASLSTYDHQRNKITFKGFGGSPDESGETALDAMIMDGYDVRSSCYSTNSLQFHLV